MATPIRLLLRVAIITSLILTVAGLSFSIVGVLLSPLNALAYTETVYDYSNITSPSSFHIAETGYINVANTTIVDATFPTRRGAGIPGWDGWGEATTTDYQNLVGSNDQYFESPDPPVGNNAAFLFSFYIHEDVISRVHQIDVDVEVGRGTAGGASNPCYIYIWNYSSNSYTILGTQTGTLDQVRSFSITQNAGEYIYPGTGQITIFVVNGDSAEPIQADDVYITIGSNQPPIANAGEDQDVPDTGDDGVEDVILDGSNSADPDGTIVSYEWREGATILNTTVSFTHSFDVGIHTVFLTVTDDNGATDTDSVTIEVEEGGGGPCFIATAAYGTPMAEEIQVLRDFRDQYLITNPMGEAFVELYYKTSPPVADFIAERPVLRSVVRTGLKPVVVISSVAVNATLTQKITIVSSIILVMTSGIIFLRRRACRSSTS